MVRISRDRMNMEDGRLDRGAFKKWGETLVGGASGTNTTSTYTVDITNGNSYNLILSANCAFTFSNPTGSGAACSFTLILKQDSTGGRTATWPVAVKWPSGTAPTLSSGAGEVDIYIFTTFDGGTTWFGSAAAQRYNPVVRTLSFVSSATSITNTITVPTVQTGDLGVLCDYATSSGGGAPTSVTPTGWTSLATDNIIGSSGTRVRVSYKILSASDSGTSVTGMDGSGSDQKVMMVFRGDIAISTVTPGSWAAENVATNPNLQSVTASGQAVPLVVIGCAAADGSTAAFSTASPAFDATVLTSDSDMIMGYKIYNSSPSDHSIDMNDLGTNALASGYIICS